MTRPTWQGILHHSVVDFGIETPRPTNPRTRAVARIIRTNANLFCRLWCSGCLGGWSSRLFSSDSMTIRWSCPPRISG